MLRRETRDDGQTISALLIACVTIAALFWARSILIPLALAVFLTFVLGPLANRLRTWGLGRVFSVLVTVAFALSIAASFAWLISWQVAGLAQELPNKSGTILKKLEAIQSWVEPNPGGRFAKFIKEVEQTIYPKSPPTAPESNPVPVVIESKQPKWLGHIESIVSPVAEFAAQGALAFLLVVFLLLGREDMRNRVIRLIGPQRVTATTRAIDDAVARISRFLRVQLFVNAAFGACLAVGLFIVGVPYALLWGFFAGLLRYIPYIGTWVGFAPPFIAAIAMSEGWMQPLGVICLYILLEVTFAGAIEPRFFGKSLGLSEVAQVLSAAFWAFLWGPIGLILSGPMTACLLVLGKNVPSMKWIDVILGDEEPLPASMRLFQRLAARDRDEAATIAEEFVEENTSSQLADGLLIPTLAQLHESLGRHDLSDEDVRAMVSIARQIAIDMEDANLISPVETESEPITVLGIAALGQAEQLALELLKARLNPERWKMVILPEGTLASETISQVAKEKTAIVVVISLAPTGFPHARYLSKRLRTAAPDLRLLVCRWGDPSTFQEEREALRKIDVDEVSGDLQGTLKVLEAWSGMLEKQEPALVSTPDNSEPAKIGTSSAL